MSQELQHLIDRIQGEAVDKATKESEQLLDQAKTQAAQIISDAEAQAEALILAAEKKAEIYTARSQKTLEQAGRNLLISVGSGVETILNQLVRDAVDEAMDIQTLREMIIKTVGAYTEKPGQEGRIDLLLSEQDQDALKQFFQVRFQAALSKNLTIHVDPEMAKGFCISYQGEKAFHDFTQEAIANVLAEFLRPQLAEIVQAAAAEKVEE